MTDNEIIFRHISDNNKINKMICKDNKIFILSLEWSLKEYTKNPKGAIIYDNSDVIYLTEKYPTTKFYLLF